MDGVGGGEVGEGGGAASVRPGNRSLLFVSQCFISYQGKHIAFICPFQRIVIAKLSMVVRS